MGYITRTSVKGDRPILYNNIGVKSLPVSNIRSSSVSAIAGVKLIPAGIFICAVPSSNLHKPLSRGTIISPYTESNPTVIVNNPSVFKPGDILYRIANPGTARYQELSAIREGTTPAFGTVSAVDGTKQKQVVTVTPTTVAAGNVLTLTIEGVPVSYTATDNSIAKVTSGLKKAFDSLRSNASNLEDLELTATATNLTVKGVEDGYIFTATAAGVQGSGGSAPTITSVVTQPVGALTITPDAGSTNATVGTKIGTINDVVVGVLSRTFYLTDAFSDTDHDIVVAPYNAAMLYRNALPYLDADIVDQLKELSYTPPYGV